MNSENLELASISKRFFAFFIDEIIITVLIYFVFWNSLVTNASNVEELTIFIASLIMPILFIKFIYQTFFIWYYGATIGKMALKIKVIDYNHFGKISFLHSIIRSIGRVASEYFIYIGFVVALFTEGRQTFHDKIGRTLVVNV